MVKHTQPILPQKQTNYLSVFDYFVGLALKGLNQNDRKTDDTTPNGQRNLLILNLCSNNISSEQFIFPSLCVYVP